MPSSLPPHIREIYAMLAWARDWNINWLVDRLAGVVQLYEEEQDAISGDPDRRGDGAVR